MHQRKIVGIYGIKWVYFEFGIPPPQIFTFKIHLSSSSIRPRRRRRYRVAARSSQRVLSASRAGNTGRSHLTNKGTRVTTAVCSHIVVRIHETNRLRCVARSTVGTSWWRGVQPGRCGVRQRLDNLSERECRWPSMVPIDAINRSTAGEQRD